MIFFVANDGTVTSSVPSPVYQGASGSNDITLVAPFANWLEATVAFKLPNGVWTARYPMTQTVKLSGIINRDSRKVYSVWQFKLPNEITQYYGTVTAQFYFYAPNGIITATSSTSFQVGKGVPQILPPAPSDDIYDTLLETISTLSQTLNNGAYAARSIYKWNSEYIYGAQEITWTDTNGGKYGVFVRSKAVNNVTPPFNALGELSPQWEIVADFDEIYEYVKYGVAVSGSTLKFSPLDPNVSVENETLILERSL